MENCIISVIMPALSEEENIFRAIINVIDSFAKMEILGEIIVINDGSTDNDDGDDSSFSGRFFHCHGRHHSIWSGLCNRVDTGLCASSICDLF